MKGLRVPVLVLFSYVIIMLLVPCVANADGKKVFTLEELLSQAYEANPSAAVLKTNIEASKGIAVSASAYPNPEVELEGGIGRAAEAGGSRGEYLLGIGQTIERSAKRDFRKKAALAGVEVSERELEDIRLQIKAEIKTAFYRILKDKKIQEAAEENSKITGELLKTVELKVSAGEAPEFELVKAKVEMLKADKELKKAEKSLAVSMEVLRALFGNSLPDDFDIDGKFEIPQKKYNIQELLSNAEEKHPLVLKAIKDAEAKGYSLELEKASVYSDPVVKGFYSHESDKNTIGIGLSVPVPLWYQNIGEIEIARAEKRKAEAELFKTKVELSKAVKEEYQNYLIATDQIEVFEKGLLKQAEEALRISEFSYRQGETGLLDYLDAQRVYRSILIEYLQSLFELQASLAALERTAGLLP